MFAKTILDNELKKELAKYWLTFYRPWYDYFINKNNSSHVWFDLYENEEEKEKSYEAA